MKLLATILRLLMGALFIFASVVVLFKLMPQPEPTGNVKLFMEGVAATGYFMTLLKVTELLCGIAFVTNRFVPLATVVIAPIIVNIFCLHLFVEPSGLPVAIFLVIANIVVARSRWAAYEPLLRSR